MQQQCDWSSVGPQGRHQHVCAHATTSPPQLLPVCQRSQAIIAQLQQAIPCSQADAVTASLLTLPAIALTSIFHHLDCTSAHSLAQTCRTCAAEFAQQRAEFVQKCAEELAPTVTRIEPTFSLSQQLGIHEAAEDEEVYMCKYAYDTPVLLQVQWEQNSHCVLRQVHAMSRLPGFLDALWRHAWPKLLWSDLVADGMPEVPPSEECSDGSVLVAPMLIHAGIEVASDIFLQLPWEWLACLLDIAADSLTHVLSTTGPHQARSYRLCVWRPAQAGQLQIIMSRDCYSPVVETCPGGAGQHEYCVYTHEQYHSCEPSETIYVRPSHLQKVAITGAWSSVLPDASQDLWHAHNGCCLHCLTDGDDIAFKFGCLSDAIVVEPERLAGSYEEVCMEGSHYFLCRDVDTLLKPYTCEVEAGSDYRLKRQKAKTKGHAKKARKLSRAASRDGRMNRHQLPHSWMIEDIFLAM